MIKRDNEMDKWCSYLGVHSGRCSKYRLQVSYTVWIWMLIWTLRRHVLHQHLWVRRLDSSEYSNVRGKKKMKRVTSSIRRNNLEEGNFDEITPRWEFLLKPHVTDNPTVMFNIFLQWFPYNSIFTFMAHGGIMSVYICNAWPATFEITERFLQKLEWTSYHYKPPHLRNSLCTAIYQSVRRVISWTGSGNNVINAECWYLEQQ
jgi:hypothetical protein